MTDSSNPRRAPWAAIFDWDGVIVNSAPQHEESWRRLAHEEGRGLPPDHFTRGFGMKNEVIIPELLGWTSDPGEVRRLSDRKEALYREIVDERGLEPLPGVRPWLEALREAGIPSIIASSTPRANIVHVLDRIGLAEFFRGMIASEDVTRGKPDPQVFLLAAERLGESPGRCVVFEDTPVGIRAGKAAGMKVVGVAASHPAERLREADRIVERLDELSIAQLSRWFG